MIPHTKEFIDETRGWRGKGDHKHIAGTECPYIFRTLEAAFADFLADINAILNGSNAP